MDHFEVYDVFARCSFTLLSYTAVIGWICYSALESPKKSTWLMFWALAALYTILNVYLLTSIVVNGLNVCKKCNVTCVN